MIELVLNRFRGTGTIFEVFGWELKGNIIYAIYWVLVGTVLLGTWYGVAIGLLYMLGESMGWGKWVGSLCHTRTDKVTLEQRYEDKEGYNFPFIHQIANLIVREKKDYLSYCRVALALRGFVWWIGVYLVLAYGGLISYTAAMVIAVLLGIGFPIACYLGEKFTFKFKVWKLECLNNWERQEIFYGLMQGIALWYVILIG